MLSATPYKMYTLSTDPGEENHLEDFEKTVGFLLNDAEKSAALARHLDKLRVGIFGIDGGTPLRELEGHRAEAETILRSVMSRTERLSYGTQAKSFTRERKGTNLGLRADDLKSYVMLQRVAQMLGEPDMIEYWKSAAHPLNFMNGYKLHSLVQQASEDPTLAAGLGRILADNDGRLVSRAALDGAALPVDNPRLRWMLEHIKSQGLDVIPWIPPAMPYYSLSGPFKYAADHDATKLLVFSSWRVVPRSVASLASHHVRQELITDGWRNAAGRRKARQRLKFVVKRSRQGREQIGGLRTFNLLYPSLTLARRVDPLVFGAEEKTVGEALKIAKMQLAPLLAEAAERVSTPEGDPSVWYWAGPLLLDDHETALKWLDADESVRPLARWLDDTERGEVGAAGALGALRAVATGDINPGEPPEDVLDLLALVALGSPAVCALRALGRGSPSPPSDIELMNGAAAVAGAMRTLFNQPETIAMVGLTGRRNAHPYWRQVLSFSSAGCLQSTLDEYAHVLMDSLGLQEEGADDRVRTISRAMADSIASPWVRLSGQVLNCDEQGSMLPPEAAYFQCKFALPLGDNVEEADGAALAKRRSAFNSPFWPFVLVSTSIGQEGLDFHWYCHAITHWNLPSNPVDMEQREGRVHRFKGHAIRKNIARHLGVPRVDANDPWDSAFALAVQQRPASASELFPWWQFPWVPGDSDSLVERYLPFLPLSRDSDRLERMHRSMAAYRMVFGQPRQEDLVDFLVDKVGPDELEEFVRALFMRLEPPALPSDQSDRRRPAISPGRRPVLAAKSSIARFRRPRAVPGSAEATSASTPLAGSTDTGRERLEDTEGTARESPVHQPEHSTKRQNTRNAVTAVRILRGL